MADAPLRTSLHGRHDALGARLGPFAGWEMPLYYSSPSAEHRAVRGGTGLFDVSHMGQLELTGAGAGDYLQSMLTNDVSELGVGHGQYTLMLQDDGGTIDDLIVYRLGDTRYLAVVNASNVAACRERLAERLPTDVEMLDRTLETAMLALQGPDFEDVLGPLSDEGVWSGLSYFHAGRDTVAGVGCLVARTGYTGEPGVELLCDWDDAPRLWDALVEGGAAPAGLVSRDTLRLEMGYPLYGQELSRERTPIEAGLGWACDLDGGGFAGAEVLRAQKAEGTPERLCIFSLTESGIPRPGHAVLRGEEAVGTVTSGTLSPTLEAGIGMAYVPSEIAGPDHDIAIDVRGKRKAARTAKRPLVRTSPTKG